MSGGSALDQQEDAPSYRISRARHASALGSSQPLGTETGALQRASSTSLPHQQSPAPALQKRSAAQEESRRAGRGVQKLSSCSALPHTRCVPHRSIGSITAPGKAPRESRGAAEATAPSVSVHSSRTVPQARASPALLLPTHSP